MSHDVDSDRENLFQILTTRSTATEDEVLEFLRALEKKYADEREFFRTLPLWGHVVLPPDKIAMLLNHPWISSFKSILGLQNVKFKDIAMTCIVQKVLQTD